MFPTLRRTYLTMVVMTHGGGGVALVYAQLDALLTVSVLCLVVVHTVGLIRRYGVVAHPDAVVGVELRDRAIVAVISREGRRRSLITEPRVFEIGLIKAVTFVVAEKPFGRFRWPDWTGFERGRSAMAATVVIGPWDVSAADWRAFGFALRRRHDSKSRAG